MNVGIGFSNLKDPKESGRSVAEQALSNGRIGEPGVVLAFCSAATDARAFFDGIRSTAGETAPILGGSAIGIITNSEIAYTGSPCGALIAQAEAPLFRIASAGELNHGERAAGQRLAAELQRQPDDRALLVFYDSIKHPPTAASPPVMNASAPLIEGLEAGFAGRIPIFGAGLVGDYAFSPTVQFAGSLVGSQLAVGAVLSSRLTPYYRIMHGCTPLDGVYHRVTRAEGAVIYELDGMPAAHVIDDLYGNRDWRRTTPVDLLTIGIYQDEKFSGAEESRYVNRLITGVPPGGQGICLFEPDITEGAEIQFMVRDSLKMVESAENNSTALLEQLRAEGRQPAFALYIDCAGRTAAFSKTVVEEASMVQAALNRCQCPLLGFYSGVEIAPFRERSRGLDWTGLLIVFVQE